MSRLTTDLFEITELAHHGPEDLFIAIVTIAGALIVMFTIEWRLALVRLRDPPGRPYSSSCRCRRADAAAPRVSSSRRSGVINADIESCLSGMRTAEGVCQRSGRGGEVPPLQRDVQGLQEVFLSGDGHFHGLQHGAVHEPPLRRGCDGGRLRSSCRSRMDVVDLLTFTLYITTFVNPIRKLANFAEMFANGTAGLERFVEIMRTEPALEDAPDAQGAFAASTARSTSTTSASPTRATLDGAARRLAPCQPRRDDRGRRAVRRRQVHALPAHSALLRRHVAALSASTGRTSAPSRSRSLPPRPSASCSRTCSCSPIPSWRTSATARPDATHGRDRRRGREARGNLRRHSWPCPTASTPTSANAARFCPAGRSSASPLRASS